MAHIVMPTTAARQGGAFEDLILSHYQRSGQYTVREWWQCDGIIEDRRNRYLVYHRSQPVECLVECRQ
jgi:hypothetical protein